MSKAAEIFPSSKTVELPNALFLGQVRVLLAEGHTVTLRVRGYSMRPFLENQRDLIELVSPHTPHVGEAVLAEIAPGKYVFHRIIRIEGDQVTLMGDGNVRGTEHCLLQNVAASTQAFIRRGKRYTPDCWQWRAYSAVWKNITPLRRYLLGIYRRLPWIKREQLIIQTNHTVYEN